MDNTINRRQFIQFVGAGIIGSMTPFSTALATGTINSRKLIILSLKGGNDSVNAFPPVGLQADREHYYGIRPTIHIPQADAIMLNDTLGMHPGLYPLKGIWDAGHMALFPATSCGPVPSRSHFHQFDFFDRGHYTDFRSIDNTGWVARYLNSKFQTSAGIEAYNFGGYNYKLFSNANIPILTNQAPNNVVTGKNGGAIIAHLREVDSTIRYTGLEDSLKQTQNTLFERIDTLKSITYPDTHGFSDLKRQFLQSAALMRELPELEVIHIGTGGYDTHSRQTTEGNPLTGRHASRLTDVADSIRSLYDTLSADEKNNVTIIVRTEFSRTARENGSFGTDHGHAAAWFAVGGSINTANANYGGGQFGQWPGFTAQTLVNNNSQTVNGNYIAQTTDYRNILTEALDWIGMQNPETAFPNFSKSNYVPYNYLMA